MDETHDLVTAIVTTHNRVPSMVMRAVRSALWQTYPHMEVVVVDDSDANYPLKDEVERTICNMSPRIRYVRHADGRGANAARNTGLRRAHGRYVAFLDDDDEWFPNKIERQMERFVSSNVAGDVALVYCLCVMIDEVRGLEYVRRPKLRRGGVFDELLKDNFVGGTSNPLIRRACVDEVGGFDEQMESSQDYDLWLRIAQRHPLDYVDEPLYNYYIHDGLRISENARAKIAGGERINEKFATWIQCDDATRHAKLRALLPFYLRVYGKRRALDTWLSCVRLQPDRVLSNAKQLAMIAAGYDRYVLTAAWVRSVLPRHDTVVIRRRKR